MSVVIRGMKMPKSCDECDLNYDCFRCILPIENSLLYGKDTANERLPNCPLVELPPHGRLIDADAMLVGLDRYYHPVAQAANKMPTIIEAEEVSE